MRVQTAPFQLVLTHGSILVTSPGVFKFPDPASPGVDSYFNPAFASFKEAHDRRNMIRVFKPGTESDIGIGIHSGLTILDCMLLGPNTYQDFWLTAAQDLYVIRVGVVDIQLRWMEFGY